MDQKRVDSPEAYDKDMVPNPRVFDRYDPEHQQELEKLTDDLIADRDKPEEE